MTETWNNDKIEISGFESFNSIQLNKKSSKPSCRISGGITILYKDKFAIATSLIKTEKNYIWCKIDKTMLGLRNIYIFLEYIFLLKIQNIVTHKYLMIEVKTFRYFELMDLLCY